MTVWQLLSFSAFNKKALIFLVFFPLFRDRKILLSVSVYIWLIERNLYLYVQWKRARSVILLLCCSNKHQKLVESSKSCDNRSLQIFSTFDIKWMVQKVKLLLILDWLLQLYVSWHHLGMYVQTWKSLVVGSSRQHSEILWIARRIKILPTCSGVWTVFSPLPGK